MRRSILGLAAGLAFLLLAAALPALARCADEDCRPAAPAATRTLAPLWTATPAPTVTALPTTA